MQYIYSHNPHSEGARELSQSLGVRRIRHQGSRYQPRHDHTIINWGCGPNSFPYAGTRVLNNPELVSRASDKLAFFQHLQRTAPGVRTPEWTQDRNVARGWMDTGELVVARTVLRGHSGEGIRILELGLDFVEAPLYTKYVKKEREYRVHCFRNPRVAGQVAADRPPARIIDFQRKALRPDFVGVPNWRVRNLAGGFIYVRNDVQLPEDVSRQALQAFEASGLDFGAVDVIWNEHHGQAYVLEINTAPGLTGTTVERYRDAFREVLRV